MNKTLMILALVLSACGSTRPAAKIVTPDSAPEVPGAEYCYFHKNAFVACSHSRAACQRVADIRNPGCVCVPVEGDELP